MRKLIFLPLVLLCLAAGCGRDGAGCRAKGCVRCGLRALVRLGKGARRACKADHKSDAHCLSTHFS